VEMGNTLRSFRGDETVPADYATKTATTGGGQMHAHDGDFGGRVAK